MKLIDSLRVFVAESLRDVRFSVRVLRRFPGFAIAAVLTLAMAIGANAVVFGVMNGLILRPLDVPQAESLWGTVYGVHTGFQSYPNYVDLRDRNRSFEDLAAFQFTFAGLDKGQGPSKASGFATTGNYFDVLRIQPYLGRFFHRAEEHGRNSAPYVVLSYAYWHGAFQGDRGVVGQTVRLNKQPLTIVGVAPPGFHGTLLFFSPDFFMPIVNRGSVMGEDLLDARASNMGVFEAFGHLKPGVTPAQAAADARSVGAYLEKTYPKESGHTSAPLAHPGLTSFGAVAGAFFAGLMLLAGMILLAACANLGGLYAARTADRAREVALRLALGATRMRILRQLLTDAVLIGLVGGAVGLLGTIVLLRWLSVWQPFPGAPVQLPVNPDARIYLVALALAVMSGLLFGIVPLRQVLQTSPAAIVKAPSGGKSWKRLTLRDGLLLLQIAVSAVLVTSSMVAVRGLVRSLHANFGFDAGKAMLVSTDLATAGYSPDSVLAMQKRLIDAMEAIPGVERVGLVNNFAPLVNGAGIRANVFKDEARDLKASEAVSMPYRYEVSPRYFDAAGTTLLAGRDFTWHDDNDAPAVGVANREFATRIFGSVTAAVGRYFRLQDGTRVQVVGVVEDGKYLSLTEDQQPAMFLPYLQSPSARSSLVSSLVLRSQRDPRQLAAAVRSQLQHLDAGLLADVDTWNSLLHIVLFPSRVATASLAVLGLMSAMLSVTGIFGMAAYSVSKRRRELGIRVAVGADGKDVLGAVLGRAFKLLLAGSAVGLLLGILSTRVVAFLVYQATPRDPLVLGGVVLTMLLLGLVAAWIPARNALSVNASSLLREE